MRKQVKDTNLRLMVFQSAKELGEKVNEHLLKMYNISREDNTFILPIKENFFNDGHLKVEIDETVRGKDVFFITDIGNYSIEYNMHGYTNRTSPKDLIMELKDGITVLSSRTPKVNALLLYKSTKLCLYRDDPISL